MTTLVIDASAAASWLLASQATRPALALLSDLDRYELVAPSIFEWEMANLFVHKARRDAGFDLSQAFARLAEFEIEIASAIDGGAIKRLAHLAAANGLSVFDTAYLWLTLAVDGTLASRDSALLAAVKAAGQPILDLRDSA